MDKPANLYEKDELLTKLAKLAPEFVAKEEHGTLMKALTTLQHLSNQPNAELSEEDARLGITITRVLRKTNTGPRKKKKTAANIIEDLLS